MPAQIINGVITFLSQQVNANVWDGEVPRQGRQGEPVNPDAALRDWPVVKVSMAEGGFTRNHNFEDPYDDTGELVVNVWATRREQTEALLNQIEALLAQAANWAQISAILGGNPANPFYVIQLLLVRWYSGQEEEVRTSKSELLYRGDLFYECMIHGVVSTL